VQSQDRALHYTASCGKNYKRQHKVKVDVM